MILYMYIDPGAGADNHLGMKFWCQQEHPVCRKSMDSEDIVQLEYWNEGPMDNVHWVHGHCPLSRWTLSTQSMDNVHWYPGQCPLNPWTMSTQSQNFFPGFSPHFIKYRTIAIQPNWMHTSSSQCLHVYVHQYWQTYCLIGRFHKNKLHCYIHCTVVIPFITFWKIGDLSVVAKL